MIGSECIFYAYLLITAFTVLSFFFYQLLCLSHFDFRWISNPLEYYDASSANWADGFPNPTGSVVEKELCATISKASEGNVISILI